MSSLQWFLLSLVLFAFTLANRYGLHLTIANVARVPLDCFTGFAALLTIFHARDVQKGEQSE